MNEDKKLIDYINRELEFLNELIAQDETIRGLAHDKIFSNFHSNLSTDELPDFAIELRDFYIFLMDSGTVNPVHVLVCVTILSISVAILGSQPPNQLH